MYKGNILFSPKTLLNFKKKYKIQKKQRKKGQGKKSKTRSVNKKGKTVEKSNI